MLRNIYIYNYIAELGSMELYESYVWLYTCVHILYGCIQCIHPEFTRNLPNLRTEAMDLHLQLDVVTEAIAR